MKSEKGATITQFLLWGALIGFLALICIKLFPPYMEYFSVRKSLTSVAEEEGIRNKTPRAIADLLFKRFYINDVTSVKAKDLKVEKKEGKMTLKLKYENRVHVVGNIDVILMFDDTVEVE